jgi:hypothetical protein
VGAYLPMTRRALRSRRLFEKLRLLLFPLDHSAPSIMPCANRGFVPIRDSIWAILQRTDPWIVTFLLSRVAGFRCSDARTCCRRERNCPGNASAPRPCYNGDKQQVSALRGMVLSRGPLKFFQFQTQCLPDGGSDSLVCNCGSSLLPPDLWASLIEV